MGEFQGRVGIAGCGAMGLPMACNLLRAGVDAWGFDVRPIEGEFAPRMLKVAENFAARCEVVISVVRDEAQTRALLFDAQAILRVPSPPKVIVISSTLSPRFIRQLREEIPREIALIDAPMSGAPYSAEAATLTFMLGGAAHEIERLMPLFMAMGQQIHHLGDVGAGMTAKVLNNLVAASSVAATRRALAAADALGLSRDKLLNVMMGSSGQNWFASNIDRISWSREGYHPANTIGILEKDVTAMMDGIAGAGLSANDLEEAVIRSLRTLVRE